MGVLQPVIAKPTPRISEILMWVYDCASGDGLGPNVR